MVKLSTVAPTFLVADVGATIRWYESELGFTSFPFPKNPPYVFASVSRDTVEIMFQHLEGFRKPDLYSLRSGGVWDAYLRISGLKDFYDKVKDRIDIKQPLHRQPYGLSEFEVRDPNGYILVFSELIE